MGISKVYVWIVWVIKLENRKLLTLYLTWSQHLEVPFFGPVSLGAFEDKLSIPTKGTYY